MTRKDYLLIAEALKSVSPQGPWVDEGDHQHKADCCAIADALAADNPNNFNREQFLSNCGVQP